VDPADPGSDVPPVGRSLFDYVMTEQQGGRMVYQVPFPFTALLERIERELEREGGSGSPLRRVLIPLNRSLQRHAAKPDYFAYPRAVVGVDSEPAKRAGFSGMLLKDRLFLGYQEKADILEVISYNEAAGRFEFQVVRDYGRGQTPKVLYANRALCTTCHQNQSPIFSRPQWDETNANRAIAKVLEEQHADFYGFPLRQGVDVPDAIDQATDRANVFSTSQLLWQEGCERAESPGDSIQCRADLFRLVLQSRMSGLSDSLGRLPGSGERATSHMMTDWSRKWPQGLKIPNPDLPNRNPVDHEPALAVFSSGHIMPAGRYGLGERAKIRSIFEPTLLREPLEIWSISPGSHEAMDRAIAGLSGFFADADIERLDSFLFAQAGSTSRTHRYQSRCEVEMRNGAGSVKRLVLRCLGPEEPSRDKANGFSMEGVLYLKGETVTGGMIERLSSGASNELVELDVIDGAVTWKDGRHSGRMMVMQKGRRLHARLAEGHAIKELTLQFGAASENSASRPAGFTGSAVMTAVEDYAPVHRALDAMARETLTGESDLFARKPFRRAGLMKGLFAHLKMPRLTWCCEETGNMPELVTMADQVVHDHDVAGQDKDLPPGFKAFHRYCAQCHHEELPFPPNFLHGPPRQVQEQIEHCAERILFRLNMWGMAPQERQEAPMPPTTALKRLQLSPQQWAGHADLALLKSYVAGLAKSQTGDSIRLRDLRTTGYDNLRACMPPPKPAAMAGALEYRATVTD
jgi:mono/diheme cytochrome c family protein